MAGRGRDAGRGTGLLPGEATREREGGACMGASWDCINRIVLVYDNQFTFEEANESLEDVSEIIFNFGLINANILKKLKDEAAGAKKNLSSQV